MMTFEEWWIKTIAYQYLEHVNLFHRDTAKRLAHDAWQAAQPKWTLCKDDLPQCSGDFIVLITNSDGEKLVVASEYDFDDDNYTGRFCDVARNYTVIAWMPLPEVPNDYNGV